MLQNNTYELFDYDHEKSTCDKSFEIVVWNRYDKINTGIVNGDHKRFLLILNLVMADKTVYQSYIFLILANF